MIASHDVHQNKALHEPLTRMDVSLPLCQHLLPHLFLLRPIPFQEHNPLRTEVSTRTLSCRGAHHNGALHNASLLLWKQVLQPHLCLSQIPSQEHELLSLSAPFQEQDLLSSRISVPAYSECEHHTSHTDGA